ncbi:MAG: hypothetical protein ABFD61_00245 [Chloroherpetonaceae bacterium]
MSKLISKVNLDDGEKYLEKIKEDELEAGIKDANYVHSQPTPATVWTIQHGLKKQPNVFITDAIGEEIIGAINFIDLDNLTITFSEAVSGTAYCN